MPRRYTVLPPIEIEDPEEIRRIEQLTTQADNDVRLKQGRKKRRPTGGRMIEFWADGAMQAELEAINPESPGVAAKELVREALGRNR
jgi:hypothetical protein